MDTAPQVCARCLMNSTVPGIRFDGAGICNYCTEFLDRSAHVLRKPADVRKRELAEFVARVKEGGRGRRYDCVVGVSGGVDSSWVLVQTVRLGLRPLAVHMDNGWNSELAQNNISNIVQALGVDLHTHVIEWEEYRALMQAFFDADVIDVELLYDNAMLAVNYRQAAMERTRHILAGTNQASEGMLMPPGWTWNKFDARHIRALARRAGCGPLRTFPAIGSLGRLWYRLARGVRWVSFLDLLDYNKFEALEVLQAEYGYKPYPYKHYESVFTRFYQGYILPEKFGVDKRILHFSTLVAAGQMTREEGLRHLQGIPYPSIEDLEQDTRYFLKKMGWSAEDLARYIARPGRAHDEHPTEWSLARRVRAAWRSWRAERRGTGDA
jgi:N-acetyl sugar amidotransferase